MGYAVRGLVGRLLLGRMEFLGSGIYLAVSFVALAMAGMGWNGMEWVGIGGTMDSVGL